MKVKIEFEVELPDDIKHTEQELEDFLRFEFNDNGSLSLKNPFAGRVYLEPVFGTFEWSRE